MAKRKPKKPNKRAAPVTTEEFDAALLQLLAECNHEELISIPGVYEVLSEHFNNDAIKRALENREED